MKIEFVKETLSTDEIYYTKIDGVYILGSVNTNEQIARANFNSIIKNKGSLKNIEILETVEL